MRYFTIIMMSFFLLAAQALPAWAACVAQNTTQNQVKAAEMPCHEMAEQDVVPMNKMSCCGTQCHCVQGLAMVLPTLMPVLRPTPVAWVVAETQLPFDSVILPIPTSPPRLRIV